jgi:hypothetical protein
VLGRVPAPPGLDTPTVPRLGHAANDAAYWFAVLHHLRVSTIAHYVVWLGPADTAEMLAVALPARVVVTDVHTRPPTELFRADTQAVLDTGGFGEIDGVGVPSSAVLGARLLVVRLTRGDGAPGTEAILSDDAMKEAALATIRHCLRDGYPDVALLLGEATRSHLSASDRHIVSLDYSVAQALRTLGRDDEARNCYERIRQRGASPGVAPAHLAGACYHLALQAHASGDDSHAGRLLIESLDFLPEHVAARALLDTLHGRDVATPR